MEINRSHQKIKENISIIENNGFNNAILNEIESDFISFIELIKLFLISERDTYYGYILMNLRIVVNFESKSIAGIKLNEYPYVFESNPLLLCKLELKEIIYIICHEIDHIVLNHPEEMVKLNPTKDGEIFYEFNLAADAAVNDRINAEIKNEKKDFMAMPNGVITSETVGKMFSIPTILPVENYLYYFNLIENKKKENKDNRQKGESDKNMNGQQSVMNSIGDGSGECDDEEKYGNLVTAKNCQNLEDHNWGLDDSDDVKNAVKELINSSYEIMSEESRGLMPGFFIEQVKKINKPTVISWEKQLKKYIGTISADKSKTRTRLNRRQPERFDLSGTKEDKKLKIVIAIDTSGSVDDRLLSKIFNEIFIILAKRKYEITVIECDADIGRVYKVRNKNDVNLEVTGRGGTAFTPVIEYINNDKYFRDALLIYFTDGYGEKRIPKPMTYRNIWVITGNKKELSVKEPYGIVLEMKNG